MRFNYINSMMQRMNRAVGDDVLDGILVLEDGIHAELIQAGVTYESL